MARVRTVELLPEIFQTPVNRQFLNATLDQLTQEPAFQQTQGYVGRRVGPGVNADDRYVVEPTKSRTDYQLEPGVIHVKTDTNSILDAITYPGISDALKLQGALTDNTDRLYTSDYYTWDPFVDFDKYVNFSQYYWLPAGPLSVDVGATTIPMTDDIAVTRANGVYTFSGYAGNNPTIRLVRGGSYRFGVAQNTKETVNFRVTQRDTSAWIIDYANNPTLTLVRGNTYVFDLSSPVALTAFYIKTIASLGTVNIYEATVSPTNPTPAVTNNGATSGLVTFTVPQDAPDTLYYCSPTEFNMRGTLNIVDGTAGTGPGFWIQTDPGVSGRIPSTPNISSRDVLGVINNGEDLGTVTFNVPQKNAQQFYYDQLTNIGSVDLVTSLQFDQINNQFVAPFTDQYGGIDGITNLDGRTVVFVNQDPTQTTEGWEYTTLFDPLLNAGNVVSGTGSYDSTTFDQATPITDPAVRYSIWKINYVYTQDNQPYMQLTSLQAVPDLSKFNILFGNEYASTGWYKTAEGIFAQIPLLTAVIDTLYYQDGTDPEIFGRIELVEQSQNSTLFIEGTTTPVTLTGARISGTTLTFTSASGILSPGMVLSGGGVTDDTFLLSGTGTTWTLNKAATGTPNTATFVQILNSKYYTSPNGVVFTNGLKVTFRGNTVPESYENQTYYVEGVGTGIRLLPVGNYVTPEPYTQSASIPFDSTPFDVGNFDATLNAPVDPEYITINRASLDLNAWTRSNRWFHIDVINAAAEYNNTTAVVDNLQRGRRPILEFRAGTRLYNFGTEAKQPVNVIDFAATDALSTINGTLGYGIDGYDFITGTRVIFAADTDPQVRNKIYSVEFVVINTTEPLSITNIVGTGSTATASFVAQTTTPFTVGSTIQISNATPSGYNGVYTVTASTATSVSFATSEIGTYIGGGLVQSGTVPYNVPVINLVPADDAQVLFDQTVVCLSGQTQQGTSYWFDGVDWLTAQQKTKVNQDPLFDVYDRAGISFSDRVVYPSSTFAGCKLLSYAKGTGTADPILGFALKYLSLSNVGDIVFDNNLYTDTFIYVKNSASDTLNVSEGFVREYTNRTAYSRELGWQRAVTKSRSRQQFQFSYTGEPLLLDVAVVDSTQVPAVQIFINSQFLESNTYTVTVGTNTTTIEFNRSYVLGDIIEVAVLSDQTSATAFYQVPVNLENNPLNANSEYFTLGTVRSHYGTICQNLIPLSGPINGANNTRDLGNIIPYGQQILQQSSPMTMAGFFMRDAEFNIFASLEYNSREYIKFKSQLLEAVVRYDYNDMTVSEILDSAVAEITKGRTDLNSFYWSDMLPASNVFTSNSTTVTSITTATFNTVQTYDFTSSNFLGLLVYLKRTVDNDTIITLLDRGTQYTVSPDSPRLTILIDLLPGDVVTINEYANTAGNFVPNTPTKLGLYPKFLPRVFLDDSYVNPVPVIQGHDGSITVAFDDIRTDILLEFEKRIYNNLKTDDNPVPLTVADVQPGYFRTTDYTQSEITTILSQSFLTWVGWNKLDYKAQDYLANNPFTYNYSSAGNRLDQASLPGAWRGIYRWFYDSDAPTTRPWEMLGFSEEPTWWAERYGPAPYTSGNLVLWNELAAGYVADPVAPYFLPEYARPASYVPGPYGLNQIPSMFPIIPAGSEGELLNPLQSVVGDFNPLAYQKSWVVGDGGPVEYSWWTSSSYPFAAMRLLALTRPAEFFSLFADRDLYKYDADLNQYLYNDRYRLDANGIQVYGRQADGTGLSKASFINWIVDYNQQLGYNSTTALEDALSSLDVRLCYRMASFSDKQLLKIFVERSSPNSTNSDLLLPDTSYNLLLYKNQPNSQLIYSSVIVEQLESGFAVYGYNGTQPYFEILSSSANGLLQTIEAGGTAVRVPKQYTQDIVQVPYGYAFINTTTVVDFLLSYGSYLETNGLLFVDQENGYTMNWTQMAKEFLYWSQQGWAPGTMINLNPVATTLRATKPISVVDTIESLTPENMLLDQNRGVLPTRDLVILREGNNFAVSSLSGSTISFLTLRFTNYESMVVLDNRSIFQDLVYDPITAARQNRVKVVASTTTDWNGVLDAQGFILNQDNIQEWSPVERYTRGTIVLYKNNYWSAQTIVQPKAKFDFNDWVKSDYTVIQKGLLPNLANKADQLANSYNINNANLERDTDLLAYGLIGFRPRQYMVDLNLDDVSQVNLYQQFLPTKGTIRAAELFKQADLGKESAEYDIYENWAVLRATYGANANKSFFELRLNEADLTSNPSTVQVVIPQQETLADQSILLSNVWRTSYKLTSPDILPTIYPRITDTALPSAGYVNIDDVDVTVFSLANPDSIAADIENIGIGTTIWAAKINSYDWGIYRCNRTPGQLVLINDNLNGTSIASFTGAHNLVAGQLIIIRYFGSDVDGVYRVLDVPSLTTITIAVNFVNTNQTSLSGEGLVFFLETMRVNQASDVASLPYVNQLIPGARAWVDNNGSGHWEVLEKQNPFTEFETLTPVNLVNNSEYGYSVAQAINNIAALVGAPNSGNGIIYTYRRGENNIYLNNVSLTLGATDADGFGNSVDFGNQTWAVAGASASNGLAGYVVPLYLVPGTNDYLQTQLLVSPIQDFNAVEFGHAVTISQDERWMYISAPGDNSVYAYGRVDIEAQAVAYVGDDVTFIFNYSDSLIIDYTEPAQMIVTVNNAEARYGYDYTINANSVVFVTPPTAGVRIGISRRQIVQVDYYTYYEISQGPGSSTTGLGAVFTVEVTRGEYAAALENAGAGYTVGDTLVVEGTEIGGLTPANDLTITVDSVDSGAILTYSVSGSGISTDTVFALKPYLYTVSDIYSFTVEVDGVIQRPHLDYDFNIDSSTNLNLLVFNYSPVAGAIIAVKSTTYWQYSDALTVAGLAADARFGASLACTISGRQVLIGAPGVDTDGFDGAGSVYAFDRGVVRYLIDDTSVTTYAIPGTVNTPLSVKLNNTFLNDSTQFINGQYIINGSDIVLDSSLALTIGDSLEIETNQFQMIQQISSGTPSEAAEFGAAVDICATSCSLYVGSPMDSTVLPQAGSAERQVNQSRLYGTITSLVANPALTTGDTIRINNIEVAVPADNTVAGLVEAINTVYWNVSIPVGIPNARASLTTDLTLYGDGTTKIFDVGTIYSAAESYTTVVYVDDVLQTSGVDYTYDNSTQQINFVSAPASGALILVVSGRMTVTVINSAAAPTNEKVTVQPGMVGSAFFDLGFNTYVWTQQLLSPNPTDLAYFGNSVNVDTGAINLVIGAKNGNTYEPVTFDGGQTYFDDRSTTFFSPVINSGVVYSYDYLPAINESATNPGKFAFGQQIYSDTVRPNDQFGYAVNYTSGRLMVGVPGRDVDPEVPTQNYGEVSIFSNPTNLPSWAVIHAQQPVVDVNLINTVFMYDRLTSNTQSYFDYIDPLQGKILGAARRNIDYIGAVDPADYNQGSIHNLGNSWAEEHVGEIWWDTDTVRFIDPNQDDIVYASRRWSQVFPGSRVDIYTWISSTVPPNQYTGPGTPLSLISYTSGTYLNNNNILEARYYFWVRGLTTISKNAGKTLSPINIAQYIESPRSSGVPYIAALNASTVGIYNAFGVVSAADTILHIGYDRTANNDNVHQEFELIADGRADSFISATLYRKLIDSFSGIDSAGANVPDPFLSPAELYGVQFRPRQSMFADRFNALKNYLQRANRVLAQYPISEIRSFVLLNSFEPEPPSIVTIDGQNQVVWNQRVANQVELSYQNLNTVPVGYKYLVASDESENGLWDIYEVGTGATTFVKTLNLVRVQNYDTRNYWSYIDWYRTGYNSTTPAVIEVPNYSALSTLTLAAVPIGSSVRVTANGQNKWEIYLRIAGGWERVGLQDGTIEFSNKIWDYQAGNFGFDGEVFDAQYFDEAPQIETRRIIEAINEELFVDELLIERNRCLILVFEIVYSEFTAPSWLIKTSLVDVDHRIRELLPYQTYLQDNQTFVLDYIQEVKPYHVQIREFNLSYSGLDSYGGMMTDFDVPAYWNTALEIPQYVSPVLLPYDYSDSTIQNTVSDSEPNAEVWLQQPWIEWFNHYLLDLQDVTVVDVGEGYTVPPQVVFGIEWNPNTSYALGQQIFYGINLYSVTVAGVTANTAPVFTQGSQSNGTATLTYVGTPATGVAVTNSLAQVIAVSITNSGSGYLTTPIITFVGGNGLGARAVAVMGNDLVRSIKTTIKYDRYQYVTTISDWTYLVANYNPDVQVRYRNKVYSANATITNTPLVLNATGTAGNLTITVPNNTNLTTGLLVIATGIPEGTVISTITVASNETTLTLSQSLLSNLNNAVVTFYNTFDPADWTLVDAGSLSGINRTEGFYTPTANQPGLDLPLLIDGLDYPGVQVMGLNYNQNTGFDIGNFDINPFDNIAFGPEGLPTYDPALLDAIYESSYLDIYLGTRPTDINVNGGEYIDTYSSHAPEELVPGSAFDTLDMRVYTRPGSDWENDGHGFPSKVINSIFTSTSVPLSFANQVPYPAQIIAVNVTNGVILDLGVDYTVDWNAQEITVLQATLGDEIQIAVYEVGGGNQLYNQIYNGANVGNQLVVPVNYSQIQNFAIFVNGTLTTDYTYQPEYAAVGVEATYSALTPTASTILIVSSTIGIQVGAQITGTGFTSGQTVVSKTNGTTLTISAVPDSTPVGVLTFTPNTDSTQIDFGTTYTIDDFVCLSAIGPTTVDNTTVNYNWSLPQTQYIVADGVTFDYPLTNSLEYTNPDNLIVTVNGVRARTSAGIEWYGDGSTQYLLPQRLGFSQEDILDNQVRVYVNDEIQPQGSVYVVEPYDPADPARAVIFTQEPAVGAKIKIFVTTNTQCFVNNNVLVFVSGLGLTPIQGDIIAVTTWNDTRQQDIITRVYVGPVTVGVTTTEPYDTTLYSAGTIDLAPGSYDYSAGGTTTVNNLFLDRVVTDPSRLWVTLNGSRLIYGNDFIVVNDELVLNDGYILKASDIVMITMFTNSVVPAAMAFRIFQDMRGAQAVYRMTPGTTTVLTQTLLATDDIIYVEDASVLSEPDFNLNIWGVIMIDGERIMYRNRDTTNNTVSSLLRGTAGTADTEHAVGAIVTELGRGNLLPLPYQNYIVSDSTLADGSTTTYVANDVNIATDDSTIRDQVVEVYVGGIRVVNHPVGLVPGETYTISELGNTDWTALGVLDTITPAVGVEFQATDAVVAAGNFVIGKEYVIISDGATSPGDSFYTKFTEIGAPNNLPGTTFVANGVGSGPGTAWAQGTGLVNYTITNDNPVTVEFASAPADGSEVTILVRRGVTWYAPGAGTPSNGVALQQTDTIPARFLRGL
jgi:hypothetical protein